VKEGMKNKKDPLEANNSNNALVKTGKKNKP
jgi:hypothetical protein